MSDEPRCVGQLGGPIPAWVEYISGDALHPSSTLLRRGRCRHILDECSKELFSLTRGVRYCTRRTYALEVHNIVAWEREANQAIKERIQTRHGE